MSALFVSHSSPQDDGFVRELQQALGNFNSDVWIDSRELRGGDPLWEEIKKGIEKASAYAVVVSTDGLQSRWVGKELRYALDVQQQRGKDKFPVIPLSLNGTKLGVLEEYFDEEPLYIAVSSGAGRLFEVVAWLEGGKPFRSGDPRLVRQEPCVVAVQTGFFSMVEAFLRQELLEQELAKMLSVAVEMHRPDLVELLLGHGASVHAVDSIMCFLTGSLR